MQSGKERRYAAPLTLPEIAPQTRVTLRNAGEEPLVLLRLTVIPATLAANSGATGAPAAVATSEVGHLAANPAEPVEFAWQTGGGPDLPLGDPYFLTIDPQGHLWVADGLNSRFQIFAPDGTFLEAWGDAGSAEGQFDFADPRLPGYGYGAAAFDRAGNLYVVDPGNRRVQKFGPDRRFLTAWGGGGGGNGQFMLPDDLAIDEQGRVYVLDRHRADVQVFDSDGRFFTTWGEYGIDKAALNDGGGIAIDAAGDVWVANWGNNRVQKFSPDGRLLAAWGGWGADEGQFNHPNDVVVDGQSRVYVADNGNDRVQVFDGDGRFLAAWGRLGTDEGQFSGPAGIPLDGTG
jgi:DNA-binding beta-propeller fold protein YncE